MLWWSCVEILTFHFHFSTIQIWATNTAVNSISGYTLKMHSSFNTPTFDLKVGLKVPLKSKDPLEAFNLFFNDLYSQIFVSNAKLLSNGSIKKKNITKNFLYRYIAFIILSGIVKLPQEKMYFYPDKKLISFFPKISFITHSQLQFAKKYFISDRRTLANIYNETSIKV